MDAEILERLELRAEQRLILPGVNWQQYLALDSLLDNVSGGNAGNHDPFPGA
ncbi:hypothetical protein [Stenomitos frigidus]|uniref:hypothetical protein n=1 Tax=Stenomitos frigidus TaxID=1886765 RepID=UPI0015E77160|nr:hypothetical protein [Stenomitos frigidus]